MTEPGQGPSPAVDRYASCDPANPGLCASLTYYPRGQLATPCPPTPGSKAGAGWGEGDVQGGDENSNPGRVDLGDGEVRIMCSIPQTAHSWQDLQQRDCMDARVPDICKQPGPSQGKGPKLESSAERLSAMGHRAVTSCHTMLA